MKERSARRRAAIDRARLNQIIDEAAVDAYGEPEQVIASTDRRTPRAALRGDRVRDTGVVRRLDVTERGEIVAICTRGRLRQPIPIPTSRCLSAIGRSGVARGYRYWPATAETRQQRAARICGSCKPARWQVTDGRCWGPQTGSEATEPPDVTIRSSGVECSRPKPPYDGSSAPAGRSGRLWFEALLHAEGRPSLREPRLEIRSARGKLPRLTRVSAKCLPRHAKLPVVAAERCWRG